MTDFKGFRIRLLASSVDHLDTKIMILPIICFLHWLPVVDRVAYKHSL